MMATRRPRVKVAANLSIRRPTKSNTTNVTGETIKQEVHVTPSEPVNEIISKDVELPIATVTSPTEETQAPEQRDVKAIPVPISAPEAPPEETFQEFKLPKPPDVNPPTTPCLYGYETNLAQSSNSFSTGEEPMSPRKHDTRPTFTLPLARKRNRTESLTSNKSLPEGVTVNKVTRKLATKQEESQRTLDNKKEIRKRLTNIENVDKQNLTMFDMIYYNPVNNPMTPPALSKRGSLENIPKSVDSREGGGNNGARSRSVSKSRSPTPVPSSSVPMPPPKQEAPPPVTLTPQLKLGPNGEMILDETSLVIENEREKEMRETLANTDIVYQDEFSGNSGYYSRIRRTKDWGDEETIRFYRCLHTIGTDFSMMLTLFPQRSRRDLKLKFKKEERINLNLVNKALLHPNEFNVDELRQQFAEEDEQIEKQREEEQQRKMEAVEQQQKEKLRKNLLMRMSVSNSPQRRISKAERVMTDGSELEGEETKKPKRKATSKKRSIGKVDPGTISSNVTTAENQNEPQQPFETDPQGQTMAVEDISEIAPVTTEPKDDAPEDEASTKRKRAPVPRKRGAAKQAVATVISAIVEETEDQHPDAVPEDNVSVLTERLDNVAPVNTPSSNDPDEETFQKTKRTSEVKKRSNAKLDSSTEVLSIMEAKAQQQSEYVPEGTVLSASTDYTPMDTLQTDGKQEASVNAAPKKPPSPMPPSVPLSPSIVEEDIQQDSIDDGYSDDGGLVVIDERTNTPINSTVHDGQKKPKQKHWPNKRFGKPRPRLISSKKKENPELLELPEDDSVVIKKDATEEVEDTNVSPDGPFDEPPAPNASDQPYVLYEPAAVATYESSANLNLPIVKYQCMDDLEEHSDEMMTTGYGKGTGGDDATIGPAAACASSSSTVVQPEQEEDLITVITLQNLDDHTHTTCLRTDVAQTVQPTLINELTPVEIKYDEYDPEDQLMLALDDTNNIVKDEHLHNASRSNQSESAAAAQQHDISGAPVNVQVIDWPPVTGSTTNVSLPYVLYGKLETYGCSSDTVITPNVMIPPQAMSPRNHMVEYAPLTQTIVNVAPMGEQPGTSATTSVYAADTLVLPGHSNEQTSLPSTSTATSCYGPVNVTPKHELANLPQSSTLHTTEVGGSEFVANTVVKSPALEIPSEAKPCKDVPIDNDPSDVGDDVVPAEGEEEEDEDGDGGFSLEDIDINSLVLVESQDSGDPNKTFYEIYVSNPDTGQLSEKPLDVPADVIESIRQILEGGGER